MHIYKNRKIQNITVLYNIHKMLNTKYIMYICKFYKYKDIYIKKYKLFHTKLIYKPKG